MTRALVSKVLVKDSATLDDDTAAAVASVSRGANGILSVKMHDKVAALGKLARAFNMFQGAPGGECKSHPHHHPYRSS